MNMVCDSLNPLSTRYTHNDIMFTSLTMNRLIILRCDHSILLHQTRTITIEMLMDNYKPFKLSLVMSGFISERILY